jgi:hypothetical protein
MLCCPFNPLFQSEHSAAKRFTLPYVQSWKLSRCSLPTVRSISLFGTTVMEKFLFALAVSEDDGHATDVVTIVLVMQIKHQSNGRANSSFSFFSI